MAVRRDHVSRKQQVGNTSITYGVASVAFRTTAPGLANILAKFKARRACRCVQLGEPDVPVDQVGQTCYAPADLVSRLMRFRFISNRIRGQIAHAQVARHAEEDFCLAKWLESAVIKARAHHFFTRRGICSRGDGGDLYLRPAVQLANPPRRFRSTQFRQTQIHPDKVRPPLLERFNPECPILRYPHLKAERVSIFRNTAALSGRLRQSERATPVGLIQG